MKLFARRTYGLHTVFWALCLSNLICHLNCNNQNKTSLSKNNINNEGQCLENDQLNILDKTFNQASFGCKAQHRGEGPILYAHFLEQTLRDDICFEDIVNNKAGLLTCAPGPFLIDRGSVVDLSENVWKLGSMPNYIVWHIDNQVSAEDSLYITNQSGVPIRSQTIKLQNHNDSTLMLFPKSALTLGAKYYIYLVQHSVETTKTWIQPISILGTLN